MMVNKHLIVIGGATATGKTGLAIKLAQHYNTEILSCDSRQFYKEMTIGTAKPNTDELQQAKHHFIDSLSIHDDYSVGDYEVDALHLLTQIYEQKDIAIVVGGSGLFIRALCDGLNDFPEVSEIIKTALAEQLQNEGIESLQSELQQSDPDYFEKVDIHNAHRLLRALGVIRVSGKTFSSFHNQPKAKRVFTPIYILAQMEREKLYEKINRRVDLMMEAGLLEEARSLHTQRHLNALQTVGYQEFFDFFEQKITLEEAIELVKRNSRRYAKRQGTWFRKEAHWTAFEAHQLEAIIAHINQVTKDSV